MPRSAVKALFYTALVALAAALPLLGDVFYVRLATQIAILGMVALSVDLLIGYGGMVTFGQAAFFGVGAYVSGILTMGGVTSAFVAWPAAILAATTCALVVGALALRTSGFQFIMVTLAFAQMIYYFAISWPAYGGEDGLSIYVRNTLGTLDTMDPLTFFLIVFALLLLVLGLTLMATRSRFGLALAMARQNPLRLTSMGVRPFRVRLTAFVLSAMAVALAGALYADLNRFVSPSMLSWHLSGELIVFVILGGTGRPCGPLIGAALYVLLETQLGQLTEYWQLPLGLILLLVVLFARGGVVGLVAGRPPSHA